MPSPSSHRDRPLPVWLRASLLYLSLPLFLFLLGWCRSWIAVPVCLGIVTSLWLLFREPLAVADPDKAAGIRKLSIVALFMMALAFCLVNGTTPPAPQSNDQLKHQLLAGDLIERAWPVRYEGSHTGEFLCYGLGYYMVPAAIAKILGLGAHALAVTAWAALGITLFFLGLIPFFGRRWPLAIPLVLLCSGAGAVWHVIKTGFIGSLLRADAVPSQLPEHLLQLGLYTSNLDSFTRMFYQPQHAIPGWLAAVTVYDLLVMRNRWAEAALVVAITAFWSPITAAALLPLVVVALIRNRISPRLFASFHLVPAGLIAAVLAAYYSAHLPIPEKGFIWDLARDGSWWIWYLAFTGCFVLAYPVLLLWIEIRIGHLGILKWVVLGMSVLLMLTPLYKLGHFGDMRLQASGPAFLFIAIAVAMTLLRRPEKRIIPPYAALCVLFMAGAVFPLFRTAENLLASTARDYRITTLRSSGMRSIKDLHMPGFDVTAQYLGDSSHPMARLLLK